jgi:hypothetical protein
MSIEEAVTMNRRWRYLISGLAIILLTASSYSFTMSPQPDSIGEMIDKIREGGFLLLAEMDGDRYRIGDESVYKDIMEKDDPVTFFLEHIESGKEWKVGYADKDSKKKDDWGKAIWDFYIWVTKQFE